MTARSLRVSVLYPDLLNIYGDRGNAMAVARRCGLRGIDVEIEHVGIGDCWSPDRTDILLAGGGQDREQRRIEEDLAARADDLRAYRDDDRVALAVCGGYQLFGLQYRGIDGAILRGAGVFDAVSAHPGPQTARCVGNVAALWEGDTLVGFENHGGRTYLDEGQEPLADVVAGFGNNGGDGSEGARSRNCFGTYLHGALLPKNPRFCDRLISLALERRYGDGTLDPIDDAGARRAHAEALHVALHGNGEGRFGPGPGA